MDSYVDPLILALVSLLFFEISFQKFSSTRKNLSFLTIAWVTNFLFIPLIGWGIASLFLSGKPLIYTGLLIYLIAPCTDWFLLSFVSSLIPFVIGALVACIFAGNITTILDNISTLSIILQAVFLFFIATYLLSEFLARRFQLAYPERALLTMTTSARNAPLMLGLTTAVFPDQPLIYAALIIGMLIEFPHLATLKHLLLRQKNLSNSEKTPSASPQPNNKEAIPSA